MNSWKSRVVAGTALTTAVLTVTATPAGASPAAHHPPSLKVVKTLTSSVVGPLQFAVAGKSVFVADSFTSTLTEIGRTKPIASGGDPSKGGDLAGVAVDPDSRALAYTSTNDSTHSATKLTILKRGDQPVVADLSGFEKKHNPDGKITYGTTSTDPCVLNALKAMQVPASYRGLVDSHPYAVAALGHDTWAVADAGGNDLLQVDRHGHVSVISVLPAQPVRITAAFAAANGLPSCAVGITYKFEAVPTDVEVGPGGALYVTTLPGGPEGPDSGNPGSVYRIDRSGHAARIATGFSGATNLAIDSHGTIYVAEISKGIISKVVCGHPETVLALPNVVALEYADGHLYASTSPAAVSEGKDLSPGSIVVLGTGGKSWSQTS